MREAVPGDKENTTAQSRNGVRSDLATTGSREGYAQRQRWVWEWVTPTPLRADSVLRRLKPTCDIGWVTERKDCKCIPGLWWCLATESKGIRRAVPGGLGEHRLYEQRSVSGPTRVATACKPKGAPAVWAAMVSKLGDKGDKWNTGCMSSGQWIKLTAA